MLLRKVSQMSRNHNSVFLVRSSELKDLNAPFFSWLIKNGFKVYSQGHGHYNSADWVYIDIEQKQYCYGKPGVNVMGYCGNHAITITEFLKIYDIFKSYEGLNPLEMRVSN